MMQRRPLGNQSPLPLAAALNHNRRKTPKEVHSLCWKLLASTQGWPRAPIPYQVSCQKGHPAAANVNPELQDNVRLVPSTFRKGEWRFLHLIPSRGPLDFPGYRGVGTVRETRQGLKRQGQGGGSWEPAGGGGGRVHVGRWGRDSTWAEAPNSQHRLHHPVNFL